MKKLIFSDINDTIKTPDGHISDFCIDTLKSVKDKVEFVLVTGKNRQKTEEFAKCYGGSRYIITSNGGEVFDTITRKTIYYEKIPDQAVKELYSLALKYKLRLILNVTEDYRFTTKQKYFDGSEKTFDKIDEVINNYNVIGMVFNEIKDRDIPKIKLEIFSSEGVVIANQEKSKSNNIIDVISAYANKGVAIKKLIRYLNTNYDDTISIGNEKNDIPMFSATHYSIAVENACEEIKAMVDEVIDSVKNDGVAKYLQRFV